jgi:signal transduction histidine kinase
MFSSLRGKLTASFILVTILTLIITLFVFYGVWQHSAIEIRKRELLRQAKSIADSIAVSQKLVAKDQLRRIIFYISRMTASRVIYANEDGFVLVDSARFERGLKIRPIIRIKNLGVFREAAGQRYLPTIKKRVVFASAPVKDLSGLNRGYILLIAPVQEVNQAQRPTLFALLWSAAAALFIAIVTAAFFSEAITRPLSRLKRAVQEMSRGRLKQSVPIETSDEIGELASSFTMMSNRIARAYQIQRDFVANVSHELRTPLTSIEGFSKALFEGKVAGSQKQKKYLEIIYTESQRISKIVRDLLALARIDAGAFNLSFEKTEVKEIFQRLEAKFTPIAERRKISLNFDSKNYVFYTDGAVVEQILGNLIENAIKWSKKESQVEVWFEANTSIIFHVKDNGPGIPLEYQEKIFDRFYQQPKVKQKPTGAGLGLALCKEMVKQLKGEIYVTSQPGQGAVFSVKLPLKTKS